MNGGNPAAGGSAAVASEAAADYLAKQYNDGKTAINPKTGEFDPNLLPEDAKTQIRDLTAAIGAVVGGTVGDSAFEAQISGVVGQNAVENNEFSIVTNGVEKKLAENKKEKELKDKWLAECKNKSCITPIPEKTVSDKVVNPVNDLTIRQLAAVLGAKYDPLTGEEITPRERQDAKVGMLGLGFTKTVSGVTRVSDDVLIAIEKQYGKEIAEQMLGGNVFSPSSKNPLAKDAMPRNTDRLVLNQGQSPTCGHNSCAMVLDTLGKPVNVDQLMQKYGYKIDGLYPQEVAKIMKDNNIDVYNFSARTLNDLSRYTSNGKPVIVRIADPKNPKEFSHFVVVDGITEKNAQKVVAIRDPHGKSYFSPVDTFKKAFTGEAIVPRNYK